ncbi:histidine phosphatase family protein [Mycetocola reblochoni]|uniref:Histidine phosphatase family protein n=2 Tax=Mycetocola reblochoni TaxID=331618 RepID=A0A3L6ZQ42_9MICO|nr:histidine phosphatase family protein [Mycetocola reblochoni]RLP69958.1 histidine phosphatase family protein [Mycetocola reblochoni]SJN29851.1 putative phosphoglycerate mutase [Mycetocola reblochoni REB411]
MRLIFVRHGQTPANVLGSLDTDAPGPGLTDLGHEQALAVVDELGGYDIDRLVVSTLQRTHLTAAPFVEASGLAPVERPGIREIAAGSWEKRNDAASVQGYMDAVFGWVGGALERRIPGAESGHEVFSRVNAVVDEFSGDETVAMFSHGALIRAWVGANAPEAGVDYVRARPLANTGVVSLVGDPAAGWRLERWESERLI